MGFSLGQKFRNLFFVTRDKNRHVLTAGKQYIMTRQGHIEQVEQMIAPEPTPEVPTDPVDPVDPGTGGDTGTGGEIDNTTSPVPILPYDENPNVLLALGAKGDLRHTEIIQRNLSTIFSNSIHKGELYYTPDNFEQLRGQLRVELPSSSLQWNRGEALVDTNTGTTAAIATDGLVYQTTGGSGSSTSAAIITDKAKLVLEGLTLPRVWEPVQPNRGAYTGFRLRYDGQPVPAGGVSMYRFGVNQGRSQERFLRTEEAALIHDMVKEPYFLSLFNEGGIPTGEKLMDFTAPQRLLVPAGTSTIHMHADTPPSAAFGLTFKRNGTAFGTLTFNPSGSLSGTVTETWLNKGDRFTVETQNIGEPSMTNLAMTMMLKRDV